MSIVIPQGYPLGWLEQDRANSPQYSLVLYIRPSGAGMPQYHPRRHEISKNSDEMILF